MPKSDSSAKWMKSLGKGKPKPELIRVLVVDDHEVVRLGLKTLFKSASRIKVVGEASTVAGAVKGANRLKPDVVLLDMRLQNGTGAEACKKILGRNPNVRILFLTDLAEDESVLNAILAGAHGYLLKGINSDGLIASIETIAAGEAILHPNLIQRVFGWIKSLSLQPSLAELSSLTAVERQILALVASCKTNKEVATELRFSEKTVKNYLSMIFQKLHITSRCQATLMFAKSLPPRTK